ncbi:hypothetical protein CISIN_1g035199mg [Citrus sinensis]|uniref:Uncharacterized protein n=1 Tax=Citrus sinensis TaxID=2711 RepID=A0A067D0X7_CITSI|nr:hypothetical protein CISIN_1g035199mg [Citrus sinensis]
MNDLCCMACNYIWCFILYKFSKSSNPEYALLFLLFVDFYIFRYNFDNGLLDFFTCTGQQFVVQLSIRGGR